MENYSIYSLAKKYYPETVRIRHEIHMNPELGFEEFHTSKIITETLESLGIETHKNIAKTGVVGILRGNQPGKTILLRADMDALPINEETSLDYCSKVKNKMHACGHDGHTAGLLGAAMILSELKDYIHGNIKFLFQPAEETDGGALPMIEEGVLENPKVDAAFGCHLWGGTEEGKINIKHGPAMAAPDTFSFTIIGKGGHGAMPHLAIDPITICSQVINHIQSIISRNINPLQPAVISFGTINGGDTFNAIPSEVTVSGTIRTFDEKVRKTIPIAIENILKAQKVSHNCDYKFHFEEKFPALINDHKMTDFIKGSLSKVVGDENVLELEEPSMGGEDFAHFTKRVPSSFFFVGISKDLSDPVIHHHPSFQWDDKNLLKVSASFAQITMDFLKE